MATINDFIQCPKCNKRFLKATPKSKSEWFCHGCHTFFSLWELVWQWGLDAGNLYGDKTSTPTSAMMDFEPYWLSGYERWDAYQVVNRMFQGIEEVDDYLDLMDTNMDALQIGVQ